MMQSEAKWLLIFDNADDPDLLRDYWPACTSGSILTTSRDPRSKLTPSEASMSLEVPPLDAEQAASMLKKLSHQDKDHASALKIAKLLGGLPLAIRQMAAVIEYQYLSFAEFLEHYEDDEDRRELLREGDPPDLARGNMATIWSIEQLQPIPRTLLDICAVLDPDRIQDRILRGGLEQDNVLVGFPESKKQYRDARTELIKRALVSRNEETEDFWVHRVLQDCVISKMSRERLQEVYAAAVQLISTAWGTTNLVRRHDIGLSKDRESLYPHALRLKGLYERHDFLQQQQSVSLQLGLLMNEAGW